MTKKKSILVDLSKLNNLNCGLGQVNLYTALYLSKIRLPYNFSFFIPKSFNGFFGKSIKYVFLTSWRRFFRDKKTYDLLHVTNQLSPYKFKSKHKVLTIHDLNFISEKKKIKHHKYLRLVNKNLKNADVVVYISNYTKNYVNKKIKIKNHIEQKVIYNGVDIDVNKNVEKPCYIGDSPFLFTLGEVKKKKNFSVLIDFIKLLPDHFKIYIAGNNRTAYAELLRKKIESESLTEKILLLGIISEEDKIYLYRNCRAFLFPSLYEGFGLPIIEAMRFGKPVFSSTSSSLPEIGGNLAFYWENFDPQNMLDVYNKGMEVYHTDADYSQKLKDYSQKFSWDKNIREYLKIYQRLLVSEDKNIS